MRSSLDAKAGDKTAAETDWQAALMAADSRETIEDKKDAWLNLGDLMRAWNDPRAEDLFQKILSVPPAKTAFDVHAFYCMGAIMEERNDIPHAIEYYEKGLALSHDMKDRYDISTPDHHGVRIFFLDEDARPIREKLAKLKSDPAASPAPTP
jgi:tetratricopeptide (TPR) repeat protein